MHRCASCSERCLASGSALAHVRRGEQLPRLDLQRRGDLRDPIDAGPGPAGQHLVHLCARHPGEVRKRVQRDPSLACELSHVLRKQFSERPGFHDPTVGLLRDSGLQDPGLPFGYAPSVLFHPRSWPPRGVRRAGAEDRARQHPVLRSVRVLRRAPARAVRAPRRPAGRVACLLGLPGTRVRGSRNGSGGEPRHGARPQGLPECLCASNGKRPLGCVPGESLDVGARP